MKRLIVIGALALLNGCGATAELKPAPGASLPVKPLAAVDTPTAEALLTPSDQARPQRNDDVLRRSEVRKPDRFDLPPPG